ncbi:MAG: glycosyltransferase family 39 protein [Caldilineaceae bacterium]
MNRHLPMRFAHSILPETLILAVAALTRFWRLGYHSLWFDEAVSLIWAGADAVYTWDKTFALVEEKHPPAYYLTLHFWQRFLDLFGLGQNDIALRALGSLLGVLTVLGVLLLVTRLSGRRVALLAGLLVALSPALVWYSQELRMFQPAVTGIVWGIYFLAVGVDDRRRNTQHASRITHYALSILSLTYALYSYLFAAFAMPGIGLGLLILCWRDGRLRWRRFLEGVTALAIVTALFLPLARNAWLVNTDQSPPGELFGGFLRYLWRQLRTFTVWQVEWPDLAVTGILLLFALLAGWGIMRPASDRRRADTRLLLTVWIALPLLVAGVMQATNANVLKEDRYFLFVGPFVLWAAAQGIVSLADHWPRLGWSAATVTALALVLALPPLWTPRLSRENWRAAADVIADYQDAGPDLPAAGVIHADYLYRALDWYLHRRYSFDDLPVYQIFNGPIAPADMEIIGPRLAGIEGTGAQTLWLVQSHLEGIDDDRHLQGWLDARYPVITAQHPTGIQVTGYALRTEYDALPELSDAAVTPNTELADGLTLAACEITTPVVAAQDEALHPPSGWVHVRMWWQPTQPLPQNYVSRAQVIGEQGAWGDELPRPNAPLNVHPTTTWTPGHYYRDEADINLNPSTPPGRYPVYISVQDADGVTSRERILCGVVIEDL